MDKKINVKVERLDIGQGFIALFRAGVEGIDVETLPQVDLSRNKHGKCMFRVDQMQFHDGHAPTFVTLDGDEGANQYIDRVLGDIKAGLVDAGVVVEEEVEDYKAKIVPVPFPGSTPPSTN